MHVFDALSLVVTTLFVLVAIHVSVYFVVRWMYPAAPVPVKVEAPSPPLPPTVIVPPPAPPKETFAEPAQTVNVPTYEKQVRMEGVVEDGATDLSALTARPAA
uniref:Uncharacterized protein n=1 Tax=viral metagenome TaxID=1070528 RepID=A0A6C0M1R3_9ZZZZ